MIVTISDGEVEGYGEATVNPYYNSTVQKMTESIAQVIPIFKDLKENLHPSDLWEQLLQVLPNDFFALCAVDVAYWDYYARKKKRTLRSFWSDSDQTPLSNYTIGIDATSKMKAKILAKPWPLYKIKLGTDQDLAIIEQLRAITDSLFRIDANCAWRLEDVVTLSRKLKQNNVQFIEQPLPADAWEAMRGLKTTSHLPLIADESCQREEDVSRCTEGFHGVNIKLMKCGGITPALRMIEEARSLDLKVMMGCMTESSIGISAIAQLAPLLDYLDADGAMLLKDDVATGINFDDGKIVYANSYGSGATYHAHTYVIE